MLSLENVAYRYKQGDRDVLSGVTCAFENGFLHAVVGPSGSGKSTLLAIISGLDSPAAGKVTIDGADLSELDVDRYRREQVSMIFQAFQLFPLFTALENVVYPMELNGVPITEAKTKAAELLSSVDITAEKCNRYPSQLSGGEQQRVAVARALASGARTLLADEPTGNLDVANGTVVMDILRNLAHNYGYCVIVVTHDSEIADASDVVFKMTDGILTKMERKSD